MLTLAPGARVLTDPATGHGTLVSADGEVFTLNPTAAVALSTLADGGTVAHAEEELARRWPCVPSDSLRADLDVLLGQLQETGTVQQCRVALSPRDMTR
ncbi:PqqD family peptide modification chaperone [Streptomyces lydicus]|uniref:PqqD family peptide modification chaperone n=1 Tax=Streptomyces lydicus TaxID=47763 RepID=UPI0010108171|nr:PqqD family peptide modification chaperone [Streptomyces lydicus]MCZ1012208.1 PqqD family peptide modification chaperone [Streptomyces lydicus]